MNRKNCFSSLPSVNKYFVLISVQDSVGPFDDSSMSSPPTAELIRCCPKTSGQVVGCSCGIATTGYSGNNNNMRVS